MNGKRPIRKKIKCKECTKIIKDLGRTQFCDNKCSFKFHNRISRKKNKNLFKSTIVKIKRLCLGEYCRGLKYFMSEGSWNRICDKCKMSPDFRSNLINYKFEANSRSGPRA